LVFYSVDLELIFFFLILSNISGVSVGYYFMGEWGDGMTFSVKGGN